MDSVSYAIVVFWCVSVGLFRWCFVVSYGAQWNFVSCVVVVVYQS
jgi:hypothetical protein